MLKYKPERLLCATGNQASGLGPCGAGNMRWSPSSADEDPAAGSGAVRAESALSSHRDTGSPSGIAAMSAPTHRASAISGDRTNDPETGVACTIVSVSRLPSNVVHTVSSTAGLR